MDSRSGFGFAWNLEHFQNERLCHGTVLTALRGAYRFTPAQAAIFIAARQPVSTRAKGSMYPRPARLRLRESALHPAPLRETLLPLLAPSMPHDHAAGGRRSIARYARASGGQGYVQHHSMTEPNENAPGPLVLVRSVHWGTGKRGRPPPGRDTVSSRQRAGRLRAARYCSSACSGCGSRQERC